jgi:hypothetical protein
MISRPQRAGAKGFAASGRQEAVKLSNVVCQNSTRSALPRSLLVPGLPLLPLSTASRRDLGCLRATATPEPALTATKQEKTSKPMSLVFVATEVNRSFRSYHL